MPHFINLIETTCSSSQPPLLYILVGYKNKCELISEKYGECLRQFQFNSPPSPSLNQCTITSIIDLYDENHQGNEILVTYNCNEPTTTKKKLINTYLFALGILIGHGNFLNLLLLKDYNFHPLMTNQ